MLSPMMDEVFSAWFQFGILFKFNADLGLESVVSITIKVMWMRPRHRFALAVLECKCADSDNPKQVVKLPHEATYSTEKKISLQDA